MTFQELCELADKEVTLGMVDERLWDRAQTEANGVVAHAHQIYWRLRATALQEEEQRTSNDSHIQELVTRLELQEKRVRSRKNRNRWLWGAACFFGIVGAYVFPRLAVTARAHGSSSFYAFAFLGVACLALVAMAYTASRYHTHTD